MSCCAVLKCRCRLSSFGDAHRFLCMHRMRDLDDLAVFRAQTSAQTAAEHINLRSVHLLCRPQQARTAAVTHLPSAPSAHPVPVCRARENTETRDYRTFESAHRAQTTCAPARQQARKQVPQSVAQWLLPFSHTIPPRSSCTRPSSTLRGLAWKKLTNELGQTVYPFDPGEIPVN